MQTEMISTSKDQAHKKVVGDLIMSMMGVDRLAYIRHCDAQGFMVYAADGTQLASFDTKDEAFYSIRKHNLTPVNVH